MVEDGQAGRATALAARTPLLATEDWQGGLAMDQIASWSLLTRVTDSALSARGRLANVLQQIGSGRKAETFGGLGDSATASIDGRAGIGRLEAFRRAIDLTSTRLEIMQSVYARLVEISKSATERLIQQFGVFPPPLSVLNGEAAALLEEVRSLLNSAVDGDFLFNGRDSANPPLPQPITTSGMFSQIQAQLNSLAPGNAPTVISQIFVSASSNMGGTTPFSPYLSNPPGLTEARLSVRIDLDLEVAWGVKANANAVASSSAPTTGSAVRDLLLALSAIANLSDAQRAAAPDDFREVLSTLRATLVSARDALASESGAFGLTQTVLKETRKRHEALAVVFHRVASEAEDADLARLATQRALLETQLEANFRIVASLRQLSLANFLS